jgi:hypothetical protein
VIYSQAFRTPTWSETSGSVEGSIEQKFATQRILFGVFRTWWTNLIEAVPVSADELTRLQAARIEPLVVPNLLQYENIASVDNFGWNGGWEGSLVDRRLRYGAAVSGRVPAVPGVSYIVTADYTTAGRGPYTAGPNFSAFQGALLGAATAYPPPGFAPVDQFRVMAGLRFDFFTGTRSAESP